MKPQPRRSESGSLNANQPRSPSTLDAVPLHDRQRIVSGMRWTVWLAVLGAPFGYATSLILARVSPEALGTYGLLLVYIQLVQTWLYLGGDAVIINFIPRLDHDEKFSFLCSYFAIILASLVPWWIAASLWPDILHYVLGNSQPVHLQLLILYLAPICILFFFLLAILKAKLEMKWAQGLFRVVTIGSLLTYCVLFVTAPHLLKASYAELIWAVYIGLLGLAIILAVWKLLSFVKSRLHWRATRFFLPKGFWRYLLPFQMGSAISMAAGRIDYLLVLNFGGLKTLGKYMAVLMIADFMRASNNLLIDTLLPALTNLQASDNVEGATQVFAVTLRILYVANVALGCALIFLVEPILRVLGPQYSGLETPMILLACFVTLASPGTIGGTLLASVGKQSRATWLGLLRLGVSVGLFTILWPRLHLLGAVLASGFALLVFCLALPLAAKFDIPIKFTMRKEYVRFAVVVISAAAVSHYLGPFGIGMACLLWLAALGIFLVIARYDYAECKALAQYLLPAPSRETKELRIV